MTEKPEASPPKKQLIPLYAWNRKRIETDAIETYPRLNGIECPQCGEELRDTDGLYLFSNPAQTAVHCDSCGYKGGRVV